MRSIGRALTWEFWRQCRWTLLAVLSWSCFMLFWIWLITSEGSLRTWNNVPDVRAVSKAYRLSLCMVLFGCSAVLVSGFVDKSKRMAFSVRHYALPVRTSVLIAWQMVCVSVFVSVSVLVMAGCFRLFTGLSFPVLVPALFCSAVLAWTMAGLWLFVGSQVLSLMFYAVGPMLVMIGLGIPIFFRETWRPETGILGKTPLPVLFLLFLLSLLSAYLIAVAGAARDRRGDALSPLPVWERLVERLGALRVRRKEFSSPAAAQFWFEWRQKGLFMPIIAATVLAVFLVLAFAGVMGDEAFGMVLSFCSSVFWFPVGFLFGYQGMYSGKLELGVFSGTRPLNNRALSFAALKAGAASIAVTYAVCVLAISLWVWVRPLEDLHLPGKAVALLYLHALGYLCGVLLSGWTLMALGACMTLTGHKWVLGVLAEIFFVFLFGTIALEKSGLLSAGTREALLKTLGIIIGFGCLLGTSAAFRAAYRKRLIGKRLVLLSAGLWLVLVVCAAGNYVRSPVPLEPMSLSLFVLFVGLTALPVAPLALAPLALSWNRHR